MKRFSVSLIGVITILALAIGLAAPASASDDGRFGDYRAIRNTTFGFHYTNVRDGSYSQNHCSVYMHNNTSIAKKYGPYLRVRGNINDWLYFGGSHIVSPGETDTWDVPDSAITDSLEPYITVSEYTFHDNVWEFVGTVTIDFYNPTPDTVFDFIGPWGSQGADTGFTDC